MSCVRSSRGVDLCPAGKGLRKRRCPALLPILTLTTLAVVTATASAEPGRLTLTASPNVTLPLGSDAALYGTGGGATLSGQIAFRSAPVLSLGIEAGYGFVPLEVLTSMSLISLGPRLGFTWSPVSFLTLTARAGVGGFYGMLNERNGTTSVSGYALGGGGIAIRLGSTLSLGMEVAYRRFFGLYNDLCLGVGVSLRPQAAAPRPQTQRPAAVRPEPLEQSQTGLEMTRVSFESVFPVFYKHYDQAPVGTAVLRNTGAQTAQDVKVSLWVKEYMVNPKTVSLPAVVEPGQEVEVDLYALFTSKLLELSEGTKVSANVTLEYRQGGDTRTQDYVESIRILDRNALTWDDDRKVAAFVSAKDPTVLRFSKNVASIIAGRANTTVNKNLLLAMAMHEALRLYGLGYVVDPTSPHAASTQDRSTVDFLQFPPQTLEYKAGDCDDLSVLFCALLESVGVPTAFITIPGHIYMAVGLGMRPETARNTYLRPDELIYQGEETWLPVEVTMRSQGFLEAWEQGAKEWRENQTRGQTGFLVNQECWQTYEPVGISGTAAAITTPAEADLLRVLQDEVVRFVDREIYPQVARLQAEVRRDQSSPRSVNQLGVLYARYGLYDRAQAEFRKAVEREEYVPALLNLGNIAHLVSDDRAAAEYFDRAYRREPERPTVLLAIARLNHQMENYGLVREMYGKLEERDPDLARQYAYLDLRGEEAQRALQLAELEGAVVWDESG